MRDGEYSVMNMGDSLSDGREWYRTIYHLSGDQISFTGTRGWTRYSHEGRSGFSAQDYLEPTEFFSDGVSEGIQPFYDPAQEMFDWNYYKLYTGKDPDVIQIFLGTNGLKDNPSDTVKAIAQMVDNIRRHDSEIPIYLVNTIYWADQEKIGTMLRQDGKAFLPGEFKNRSDKRIMDLMKAMDREFRDEKGVTLIPLALTMLRQDGKAFLPGEFKNRSDKRIMDLMKAMDREFRDEKGVTLIPLALMHNSAENYMDGDALHPGENGYQQFAEVMYSVYCGTLPQMLKK